VRSESSTTDCVISNRQTAYGHASDRRSTKRQATDGKPAECGGPDAYSPDAEQSKCYPADGETAASETPYGHQTRSDISNSDDTPRMTPGLAPLRIGTRGDSDQRQLT
jgi:hypothetical protein